MYISAIKEIIPDMEDKDFLSNPVGVINAVKALIYWEQKERVWSSIDDDGDDGFFPSAIDLMANRYWQVPTEFIKVITFNQLAICMKWYEWNLNLAAGDKWKKRNIMLLHELENTDEQMEKDREQIKKDREFLKKHWSMSKK